MDSVGGFRVALFYFIFKKKRQLPQYPIMLPMDILESRR